MTDKEKLEHMINVSDIRREEALSLRAENERLKETVSELYEAYNELLSEAIESRRVTHGDFRGGPEKHYREDIELRDKIKTLIEGGK